MVTIRDNYLPPGVGINTQWFENDNQPADAGWLLLSVTDSEHLVNLPRRIRTPERLQADEHVVPEHFGGEVGAGGF